MYLHKLKVISRRLSHLRKISLFCIHLGVGRGPMNIRSTLFKVVLEFPLPLLDLFMAGIFHKRISLKRHYPLIQFQSLAANGLSLANKTSIDSSYSRGRPSLNSSFGKPSKKW